MSGHDTVNGDTEPAHTLSPFALHLPFDPARPPVRPPAGCWDPLLYQVSRALWDDHQPDAHRVGLVKSARLRCLRILVDQPAEDRPSLDPGGGQVSDVRRRVGRLLAK